jgi:maltose O-acetyltransferase
MYYNKINYKYRSEQFRSCGKNVRISEEVEITAPEKLCIGDGVFIARGTLIGAIGGIHIGNYCGIGAFCEIFSLEHRYAGAESIPFDDVRIVKPVWIEDFVFIGSNVSILPGVRIGEGSIVGLGSVVTKDVEPLKIVMGNPAQVIGSRDRNAFERLKAGGKYREPSCPPKHLWIPPYIQRKYAKELSVLGFEEGDMKGIFLDPRYKK